MYKRNISTSRSEVISIVAVGYLFMPLSFTLANCKYRLGRLRTEVCVLPATPARCGSCKPRPLPPESKLALDKGFAGEPFA
jgi:hypothetical protein